MSNSQSKLSLTSSPLWVVYVLECSDKTYYTGITNNLERRLSQHEAGKGAKYTRGRGPFIVRHTEAFEGRGEATKREYAIKQLSKQDKEKLFGTVVDTKV